jgi:hypothetical protein
MQCLENTVETDAAPESVQPRSSGFAFFSAILGILGPFSAGVMWIASVNNFVIRANLIMTFFACGLTSLLGLLLAIISFEQIRGSEGSLKGREYAVIGTCTSAAWLLMVCIGLLLPVIHSVNS